MPQYAFLVPARPGYEIIKIFLCFEFFTAEHAEIAESNIQKTKFKKVSSFLRLYILILLCVLRAL